MKKLYEDENRVFSEEFAKMRDLLGTAKEKKGSEKKGSIPENVQLKRDMVRRVEKGVSKEGTWENSLETAITGVNPAFLEILNPKPKPRAKKPKSGVSCVSMGGKIRKYYNKKKPCNSSTDIPDMPSAKDIPSKQSLGEAENALVELAGDLVVGKAGDLVVGKAGDLVVGKESKKGLVGTESKKGLAGKESKKGLVVGREGKELQSSIATARILEKKHEKRFESKNASRAKAGKKISRNINNAQFFKGGKIPGNKNIGLTKEVIKRKKQLYSKRAEECFSNKALEETKSRNKVYKMREALAREAVTKKSFFENPGWKVCTFSKGYHTQGPVEKADLRKDKPPLVFFH